MKKFVKLIVSAILIVISAFCIAGCSKKADPIYLDMETVLFSNERTLVETKSKKQDLYIVNYSSYHYVNSFSIKILFYKMKDDKVIYSNVIDWNKNNTSSDFFKRRERVYLTTVPKNTYCEIKSSIGYFLFPAQDEKTYARYYRASINGAVPGECGEINFKDESQFIMVIYDWYIVLDEYENFRILHTYIKELSDDFNIYYVERYTTNYIGYNAYKFYISYSGGSGVVDISHFGFTLEPYS